LCQSKTGVGATDINGNNLHYLLVKLVVADVAA